MAMEEYFMAKTWLITGSSRGFGWELAKAVLEDGDTVVATARHPEQLDDLVRRYGDRVRTCALDVTDPEASRAAVKLAVDVFGRLDVVVNNAGYGHFGMIEELTEDDIRAQLETNLFGALWVTQAALPIMRAQGGGRIVEHGVDPEHSHALLRVRCSSICLPVRRVAWGASDMPRRSPRAKRRNELDAGERT